MQQKAVHYTLELCAIQCSSLQYSAVKFSAMLDNSVQCYVIQFRVEGVMPRLGTGGVRTMNRILGQSPVNHWPGIDCEAASIALSQGLVARQLAEGDNK